MDLDFSFLSQDKALEGVLTPAAIDAEARASKTAEQCAQNQQAPPLVLELRGARTSQEVPDSWTLWDSNRQANGAGGVPQHPLELAPHKGPNAVPEGSTSFSRAFAHMKQRPGYEPPNPAQRPQDSVQGTHAAGSKAPNARAIQVSRRQTNNPLLRSIRNVPWEYAEIVPDYQMGAQTCCLFLSLRYHLLKPNYIYTRMDGLQRGFRLRVLLCLVDAEDNTKTLIDIHKVTVVNGWTLILAWSPEEAARYLETYQTYEHKQADNIQQRIEGDYLSRLTDVLTTIRSVNRTDVANLSTSLGSLASLMRAPKERLSLCPGVGDKKVQRIYDAFHQPFLSCKKPRTSAPSLEMLEQAEAPPDALMEGDSSDGPH